MPISTLTSKGQLTLPKAIRDRLRVRPGDRVEFRLTGEGQIVVEAASQDLRALKGSLKSGGKHMTLKEMEEEIRKAGAGR